MKNTPPTLAITTVIPTFDRDQVLVDTVEALLTLEVQPQEIILVDQTSQHESNVTNQLTTWQDRGYVKWIRLSKPSIPRAMNQGLLEARCDLILFLDDDIIPDKSLIEAHITAHKTQPGELIAGRVLQPWHNGQPDLSIEVPFHFNSLESRVVTEFMGGNFSLSRTEALKVGGFDENFVRVAYRFEAEFAYRWLASQRKIRYEPRALIHHLKVPSGGTRTYGEHLTTINPDHAVGAYYYFLRINRFKSIPDILRRITKSVVTKHHLKRPWWIIVSLIAELRGLMWAIYLYLQGPRLLDGQETT